MNTVHHAPHRVSANRVSVTACDSDSHPDSRPELHPELHPDSHHDGRGTWTQRRIRGAIVWYQRVRDGRPSPCRFYPTCSSYALEAFNTYGTRRGGWLTLRRLLRCRPLGPSGFDPVPERTAAHTPVAPPIRSTHTVRSTQTIRSTQKGA